MRSLVLLAAVASAGCWHTPSNEPPPQARVSPSAAGLQEAAPEEPAARSSDEPAFGGRCVRPTPALAPPGVPPGPAPGCPADPEGGPKALPLVHVEFDDVAGLGLDAELVRSAHDTERGLMYRKELAEDRGMLFDLRVREDHKFWMHDTCIPLDMLFIDFDGLIVGIVENAPTLNEDTRSVGCPSRWVLEVNAGWARRHGVRAGQRVEFPEAVRGR